MKQYIKHLPRPVFVAVRQSWYRLKRLNPFISSRYIYVFGGRFLDLKSRKTVELKPSLYIIGAEKAGTTSLHQYLDQHPDIFMSKPDKEPQYLLPLEKIKEYHQKSGIPVRNQRDVLKNLMLQGYAGETVFGESTTSYTRGRNVSKRGIPEIMEAQSPQPKLIYIVRHPLDRIVSNYMHKKRGEGTELSLDEEVTEHGNYLYTSLYGSQARKYLRALPAQNIQLLFFEDFIANPQEILQNACDFLGVDSSFSFKTTTKFNTGSNRKGKQEDPKFSAETYTRLMEKINKDLPKIEHYWSKKPPWTFNKSDWT